jgi:TonB family protein
MRLRARTPTCLTLLLAVALLQGHAAAQPAGGAPKAEAAPAPAIVPPKPITPLHADYPEGAQGDADVVVAVVVNTDGSVRSARVVTGDEPFASAAVAASSSWRFEPATRDGKPIVASIRAQIRFIAPVPEEPPPTAPGPPVPTVPGAPPPKPPPPPLEVTVRGEHPPGAASISRAEVRLLPGAFGDPFRAIDALPGVTPLASGVPFFYVRGSPPGNVGYFLDGIRVPLLYHIGLGPSVVHPAIMDRVDLYPGGYPAQFGRYAGGIVSGETKEPATGLHGEANIRIVDAGLMVELPLGILGKIPLLGGLTEAKGSFFAAGRYSYTGLLLSIVSSALSLSYWDYQTRLSLDFTPRDTLTIFAFGAHDFLGQKENGDVTTLFNTTFHRLDLRYDHRYGGPDDKVRQAITFGYDETSFDKGSFAGDHLLASRTEIQKRATDTVLVRAGLDGQLDGYQADLHAAFPDARAFTSLFSNRIDVTMGVHADAVIAVTPRFEVTPGVRLDFWESKGAHAIAGVDPRLSARLGLTKDIRLVTAHGLASQPPSFILPGPGFTRDFTGGLQRSWQSSIGVEADLPWDVNGTLTVFRNAFFNMTDALGTAPVPTRGDNFPSNFDSRVDGSSIGLEILLKRRLTRRLGGLISYTLSRSERFLPHGHVASAFDRTHVLNVAGTYDFGRGFKGGTRIVFYTGYPIDATNPALGRIPPFGRFDARIEKRWSIVSGRAWISLVLEAQNAFGAKETLQEQCVSLNKPCASLQIGPVTIPSIGLDGGF